MALKSGKTKYPVLMVHGVGFRDLKWPLYWGRIPNALSDIGTELFYGQQDCWARIEDNAKSLKARIRQILDETDSEKVNIIAHSKGGLEARMVASTLGMGGQIASITTIGTPHRGSKTIDRLLKAPDSLFNIASFAVDNWIGLIGDTKPNFYAVCKDFSTEYAEKFNYGILSGRNVNELIDTTRELDGQSEKHNACDFALWKKAAPEHIMHWPSPWSEGFPGWHLECSTMSEKYLGEEFDIHGGGLDLLFPHHECEIAQSCAAKGHPTVHYWMHNNMITIDGKKMGKSYGNFITLDEFFTGSHPKLQQAYSPMTIRFFILMAHYRSTVDFSNEALQSAEKGLKRMMEGYASVARMKASTTSDATAQSLQAVKALEEKMYEAMNDDLTTPIVISNLYELVTLVNKVIDGQAQLDAEGIEYVKKVFGTFLFDILGMKDESGAGASDDKSAAYKGAVDLLLEVRSQAKNNKDWATSDLIRNKLAALGFQVKDTKDGATWTL